jgi:hypothetical protein
VFNVATLTFLAFGIGVDEQLGRGSEGRRRGGMGIELMEKGKGKGYIEIGVKE